MENDVNIPNGSGEDLDPRVESPIIDASETECLF